MSFAFTLKLKRDNVPTNERPRSNTLLEGGVKPRSRVMCLSLFDKKLSPKTNVVIKFRMQKKKQQHKNKV